MMELFKIAGKVDLEGVDKANSDLDKLGGKGGSTASKLGGFAKKAAKGVAIAGAAAVGMGVAAFAATKKVTDGFDNIAKTSTKMGVSTDAYQEMDYWASQNGISSQNMEKAVGRLNQRIGMAADGNEKYGDALTSLGVDMDGVKDGTVSTEDAMYQSISALSEMESETDKAALASELFGTKLGRELMPALQDGSLSLEEAKEKAKELGIVIDGDTLAAAEEFNDTWDDLTRSMKAFGQKVIAQLMPVFQGMMDWVLTHMPQIQAVFTAVFDVIGNVLVTVRGYVQDAIDWFVKMKNGIVDSLGGSANIFEAFEPLVENLKNTFMNLVEDVKPLWEDLKGLFDSLKPILVALGVIVGGAIVIAFGVLVGVFNGVVAALTPLINAVINFGDFAINIFNAVIAVLTGDFAGAWEYLVQAGESALSMFGNLFKAVYELIKGIITGIIDFFHGLYMTLVGNSIIPDIVNGIVEWFTNMWDWLMDIVSGIVDGVVNLFNSLVDGIKAAWDLIKSAITAAVNAVKSVITVVFNAVKSYITTAVNVWKDIITKAWNLIKSVVTTAVNAVRSVISSVFNAIRSFISTIVNGWKNIITTAWNLIKSVVTTAVNAVRSVVSSVFNAIMSVISSVMSSISSIISSIWNEIKSTITTVVNAVKSTITNVWETIKGATTTAFDAIKKAMTNPIEAARDTISRIIDRIKGFFTGLKLKIPTPSLPKMPSFSLKTGSKTIMGKEIKYPKGFGVNWNAKGGIFNKPTVFNTANAGLQGVGEAGSEAIIPLNKRTLGTIGDKIAGTMPSQSNERENATVDSNAKLEYLITQLITAVKEGKTINMDSREVGKAVSPHVKDFNTFSDNRTTKFQT